MEPEVRGPTWDWICECGEPVHRQRDDSASCDWFLHGTPPERRWFAITDEEWDNAVSAEALIAYGLEHVHQREAQGR